MKAYRILFAGLFCTVGLLLLGLAWLTQPASAQTMPPFPTNDRLRQPPTVYPPTQAGEGHQVYYMVCMVCHGDRGQGLTEEWRAVAGQEDMDCWQSGCHNPRHPPGGFIFPREVPRVVGGGALARFETAADLHDYLKASMPWHAPGSLQADEYWQLTAYLIQANEIDLPGRPLDERSAADFHLHQPIPKAAGWQGWIPYIGLGGLAAVLVMALAMRSARR